MGSESPAKAPLTRANTTTYKPVPTDVFVLIPRFLTREKKRWEFGPPTNKLLITMTHVCRLWRNVLFSTPSLRTLIDFSVSAKPQQAEAFIHRSGLAPESGYFEIQNRSTTEPDMELPNILGGRMPKLTSLSLRWFRTNLHDLDFPSLTRFNFATGATLPFRI